MTLSSLSREIIKDLAGNGRVFAAGKEYEETGQVFKFSATPTGTTACVHGSSGDYTVAVTPDVKIHCTCPYEDWVCKHSVAVLPHCLNGGYAEVMEVLTDTPPALEQTLERMPEDALRAPALRQHGAAVARLELPAVRPCAKNSPGYDDPGWSFSVPTKRGVKPRRSAATHIVRRPNHSSGGTESRPFKCRCP